VNADIAAFLQHVNDLMDLVGIFQAQSFNFDGEINFDSYNVDLLQTAA